MSKVLFTTNKYDHNGYIYISYTITCHENINKEVYIYKCKTIHEDVSITIPYNYMQSMKIGPNRIIKNYEYNSSHKLGDQEILDKVYYDVKHPKTKEKRWDEFLTSGCDCHRK